MSPGEGKDCPDIDCEPYIEDPSLPECEPLPSLLDGDCHSSYPDTCIPPPPPNLNCDDISFRTHFINLMEHIKLYQIDHAFSFLYIQYFCVVEYNLLSVRKGNAV